MNSMFNKKSSKNDVIVMRKALDKFNFEENEENKKILDDYYELSKRSLKEVKHLTEYEDEKANRILAAIAFLSAFAGVMFYVTVPKNKAGVVLEVSNWNTSVGIYYICFFVFAFMLISGAVYVLKAISPKFNIPKNYANAKKYPKSFLFFTFILEVTPEEWANSFCHKNSFDLKLEYTKQNIMETYLVAEKIRTKLVDLEVGVGLLRIAVFCLIPWVLSIIAILFFPPFNVGK